MDEMMALNLTYIISISIITFAVLILPNLSRKNLVLGVRFPNEYKERDEIKKVVRDFRFLTILFGIISIIITIVITSIFPDNFRVQTIFLLINSLIPLYPLIISAKKLKILKEDFRIEEPREKVIVNTHLSRDKINYSNISLAYYILPALVVIASAAYSLINYDRYPDMIPINYGFDGRANGFSHKSILTVLMPSLTSAFIVLTIFISNLFYLKMKQKIDPAAPEETILRLLKARRIWTKFYIISSFVLVLFISVFQTNMMINDIRQDRYFVFIILALVFFLVAISLLLAFRVGTLGEKLRYGSSDREIILPEDDDSHWYLGGVVYYNSNDPAFIVAKRLGVGYTVNMGSTIGKLCAIAIFLMIIAFSIIPF
ncbi:MAG: DUF1648 domain-containing protein [Tissierellia bacterium]|nr:DUF1648 domain-containing protein [Tissierellia bacterium]